MKPDEKRLLELSRDAYTASTSYVDSYLRNQWERNIKQWQSRHDSQSKYSSSDYRGRSRLFRPRTRAVIRKNEASAASAFFSTQDVINVAPQNDNDELDTITASLLTELVNHRLQTDIPWFHLITGGYQVAQIYGQVCSYQHWEKDGDKPSIQLIPVENIRIDPAADWIDPINTSPYVIELIPMYIGDIKAKMRDEAQWRLADDKILLAAQGEYFDSTRTTRENREDSTQNLHTAETDYSIAWVRRNIISYQGQDWFFYSLGQEHMLTEPVILKEVSILSKRPYVMGCVIIEAHRNNPAGTPELTRDLQIEINNVCNQRLDNVKLAMDKRYFVRRGKQVDVRSITRNVPGSVTLMDDPSQDVIVHSTPDVTGSSFSEQDRLNLDFDDLAGTFSGSSVQANRSLNETVGGMNMMSQEANQLAEYQLRTFTETWVEPVLRQLCELMIAYENDENLINVGGLNPNEVQAADYLLSGSYKINVNVGTGATNPQTQVERFFYGLNSLAGILGENIISKLNIEDVIEETFGKLGYKDGKRFFNLDADDPEKAQLMQTIEQLQMELQQKQNPEELAAKVRKLDAETEKVKAETVNKNMEGMFSAISTVEKGAMNHALLPGADELLQSGGFVDANGPPIANPVESIPQQPIQQNTNPNTPMNPAVGINEGIEQ